MVGYRGQTVCYYGMSNVEKAQRGYGEQYHAGLALMWAVWDEILCFLPEI